MNLEVLKEVFCNSVLNACLGEALADTYSPRYVVSVSGVSDASIVGLRCKYYRYTEGESGRRGSAIEATESGE